MGNFVLAVIGMLFGFLVGLYEAFVATVLWVWFVVPTFEVRTLPLIPTFGMLLLVGLIKNRYSMAESKEREEDPKKYQVAMIVNSLCCTSVVWGVGALVHLLM